MVFKYWVWHQSWWSCVNKTCHLRTVTPHSFLTTHDKIENTAGSIIVRPVERPDIILEYSMMFNIELFLNLTYNIMWKLMISLHIYTTHSFLHLYFYLSTYLLVLSFVHSILPNSTTTLLYWWFEQWWRWKVIENIRSLPCFFTLEYILGKLERGIYGEAQPTFWRRP